jgi:hypothetical protein
MYNLQKNILTKLPIGYTAAAQVTLNGTIIDMAAFDGIMFLAFIGLNSVQNSVVTLKVQSNNLNQAGGMADITGSSATATLGASPGNQVLLSEVFRPQQEFVRPVITITTQNTEIYSVLAILYRGYKMPLALDATVIGSALVAN